MATYQYRCSDGSLFEESHPIGEAPDTAALPLMRGTIPSAHQRPTSFQGGIRCLPAH